MADNTKTDDEFTLASPALVVIRFIGVSIAVVALIAVAVILVARHQAQQNAVSDARDFTVAEGRAAIGPVLTDGITSGNKSSLQAIDQSVKKYVLSDRVVRVKIWSADGTILYSDDARLIGQRFSLGDDELAALHSGSADADVSDLNEPENKDERQFHKLLEVYDGIKTPNGTPILFEAYLRFSSVNTSTTDLLAPILPAFIAGFVLLAMAEVPLVWRLVVRLQAGQAEREALMRKAVQAAEVERRRLASDLHDGVVQRLVGNSYALAGVAPKIAEAGLDQLARSVAQTSEQLRQSVRELRTLIVTIAPPRLHEVGLSAAIADLASQLTDAGIDSTLSVDVADNVGESQEALVYRAIQESVRNIIKHSRASEASVTVEQNRDGSIDATVSDNGIGFDPDDLEQRQREGHVGLQLLGQLIRDSGGEFDIEPGQHTGSSVRFTVKPS
jgi:two-component system, NarL family, sensor kinase